jgi:branched-chain amino acid transport system substrate-binding protein
LGSIGSCGGALASSIGGACAAIQAWASDVNARGGINGHPVKMIVIDDSATPEKALTGVKQLVEGDHVRAIVGEYSVLDSLWAKYVQAKGMPVIGGFSTEPEFAANPDFFPSGGAVPPYDYGIASLAHSSHKPKVGVMYCAEAPACALNTPLIAKSAHLFFPDVSVVYSAKIAATQPSYISECLAAKQAGVQTLVISQAGAIMLRVAQECAQQGFKPAIMTTGGVLNPVNAKDPSLQGALSVVGNVPLSDHTLPASQRFLAAMAKYASSVSPSGPEWNGVLSQVWSGGLLFEAAAKAGDIGPTSTSAQIKQALHKLTNETLGGFSSPLTFKPNTPTQVPCTFLLGVSNGTLDAPHGIAPVCVPSPTGYAQLADVLKGA